MTVQKIYQLGGFDGAKNAAVAAPPDGAANINNFNCLLWVLEFSWSAGDGFKVAQSLAPPSAAGAMRAQPGCETVAA
jgi:hypothetical protein